MTTNIDEITESLQPLFEKAEKEGLWFYSNYQGIWFSPKELKEKQAKGQFMWGAPNWQLKDPNEELLRLKEVVLNSEKNVLNFQQRIRETL